MSDLTLRQYLRRSANRVVLRRLPPCVEIAKIISASLDRKLTVREKVIMRAHLFVCRPCVRYLEQSSFVRDAARLLDSEERDAFFAGRLSEASKERLKSALRTSVAILAVCALY